MYDSVQVFARGLLAMEAASVHGPPGGVAAGSPQPPTSLRSSNLSCDLERPWDDGLSLYNYINTVREEMVRSAFGPASPMASARCSGRLEIAGGGGAGREGGGSEAL